MARSIAVRVGRVWQTLLGGTDDPAGAADSVTVDFVLGGSGLGVSPLGTSALGA